METLPKESKELTFPKRPQVSPAYKKNPIRLVSNHFTLTLAPNQPSIYLYDIKILDIDANEQLPADARTQRQAIMRNIGREIREVFGAGSWAWGLILWSTKLFKEQKTFAAKLGQKTYTVAFTKTKEISLKSDTFQDNTVAGSARQYLNIIIKRYFKEKGFQEWGMNAKFYDPNLTNKIPQFFLEVYTGFKTSCEVYQNFTPKVLIDFSSRILRSDSALYYVKEAKSTQDAREMLQGRSVVASYGNYRMWRVDDVDFTSNPTKRVPIDGKNISIAEYYKEKYNIEIKDFKQPLLVSIDRRTQKTFLLVPELVQMTGLDEDMRKDFNLMTEVAKFTRLNPDQRMQQIKSLSDPLADYFNKNYGIKMDLQSFVEGHQLAAPKLTLGGDKAFTPDRGNYQLRDTIFRPASFDKWLFVYPTNSKQDADYFIETLGKASGAYGIKVGKPVRIEIKEKSPEALKEAIRKGLTKDTQIVVAMYPPAAKKPW